MPESRPPEFGINSWLEDELYQQYLHDHKAVDDSWTKVFESNGGAAASSGNGTPAHSPVNSVVRNGAAVPANPTAPEAGAGKQLVPLRGAAARIAENMNASLSIPLATSQRVIPVKVIDENRSIGRSQGKAKSPTRTSSAGPS
jgi:multifunctional 2-oxoglutarate metabolism enzyme